MSQWLIKLFRNNPTCWIVSRRTPSGRRTCGTWSWDQGTRWRRQRKRQTRFSLGAGFPFLGASRNRRQCQWMRRNLKGGSICCQSRCEFWRWTWCTHKRNRVVVGAPSPKSRYPVTIWATNESASLSTTPPTLCARVARPVRRRAAWGTCPCHRRPWRPFYDASWSVAILCSQCASPRRDRVVSGPLRACREARTRWCYRRRPLGGLPQALVSPPSLRVTRRDVGRLSPADAGWVEKWREERMRSCWCLLSPCRLSPGTAGDCRYGSGKEYRNFLSKNFQKLPKTVIWQQRQMTAKWSRKIYQDSSRLMHMPKKKNCRRNKQKNKKNDRGSDEL